MSTWGTITKLREVEARLDAIANTMETEAMAAAEAKASCDCDAAWKKPTIGLIYSDVRQGRIKTFCHNTQQCKWSDAKPAPPSTKPIFDVQYEDDLLQLYRTIDGTRHVYECRSMAHTLAVPAVLDAWASVFGIDAKAARKLFAEPRVLATVTPNRRVCCEATRHFSGWQVKIFAKGFADPSGSIQPENIARAFFPDIQGIYLTEPQE